LVIKGFFQLYYLSTEILNYIIFLYHFMLHEHVAINVDYICRHITRRLQLAYRQNKLSK
jgi:hypothetical protein